MDSEQNDAQNTAYNRKFVPAKMSQSIDWYAEGEERIVVADEIQVAIRFVGRKGRKCRIAITAPAGATFKDLDYSGNIQSPSRFI